MYPVVAAINPELVFIWQDNGTITKNKRISFAMVVFAEAISTFRCLHHLSQGRMQKQFLPIENDMCQTIE